MGDSTIHAVEVLGYVETGRQHLIRLNVYVRGTNFRPLLVFMRGTGGGKRIRRHDLAYFQGTENLFHGAKANVPIFSG